MLKLATHYVRQIMVDLVKVSYKLPELGFVNDIAKLRKQRLSNPLADQLYRTKMQNATAAQRKMDALVRSTGHSTPRSFALFGQPQESQAIREWRPKFETLD